MKLTLCYAPTSCALVPYVTLTEAGADFDIMKVNLGKGQNHSPEYLRMNPAHKVPVLLIDGEPLTENVAIQIWMARNFPSARLLPSGAMNEVKAISLMAWVASTIQPSLAPNVAPRRFCDIPGSEENVKQCARKLLAENFAIAEQKLGGRQWFFDDFTAADVYFYWSFRRAMLFGIDLSAYPSCRAHLERVELRPSVQKVLAFEAQTQKEFAHAA